MKLPRTHIVVRALLAGTCAVSAFGAAPPQMSPRAAPKPEESKDAKPSGWVFSILPKAFQRKPQVDFNVITEMTAEGKRFPKATPEKPVYYVAQPGKFTQMGMEAPANEKPPEIPDLERAMQRSLATNGYLLKSESSPAPRLLVVFNYGSFARFSTSMEESIEEAIAEKAYLDALAAGGSAEPPEGARTPLDTADQLLPYVLSDVAKRRDVLERATLIAGAKFAKEFGDAIDQEAQYRQNSSATMSDAGRTAMDLSAGRTTNGSSGNSSRIVAPELDAASPFNRFRNNNERLMYFVEESFSSCYFVIASAYDYVAIGQGKRVLLWRTKMTVNSLGIAMKESLPALIVSAGPYLGREMKEAAIVTKRISREGHVEIGTATVVEDNVAPAPPPGKIRNTRRENETLISVLSLPTRMKTFSTCLLSVLVASPLVSQVAPESAPAPTPVPLSPPPEPKKSEGSGFVFSLLPKAFQSRPLLDLNVITEMTDEGRKVAPPTAEKPVYYIQQSGKFLQIGSAPPGNEHAPPLEVLEEAMQKSLATGGYLANPPEGQQPSLMVVFNYGSHSLDPPPTPQELQSGEPPTPKMTAEELFGRVMSDSGIAADLVERAALIGGVAFAAELRKKLVEETSNIIANANNHGAGVRLPVFPEFASPLSLYIQTAKNSALVQELVEDAFHSHYFVVASAYDFAAMAHGQRRLLWRTKMTVDTQGINMRESLPPLIVSAGPYLGRDMKEMTVISKRISREGRVEIGTAIVVEDKDNAPSAAKTPATAPADKKTPPAKP